MATKTPGKTTGKTAPAAEFSAPDAPSVKMVETPAAVNWDELPTAEVAQYTRKTGSVKVDLEEVTPSAIKSRVLLAFEASAKADGHVKFWQKCGTPEAAEEFLKLGRRYASFRTMTLRGKVTTDAELNILIQDGKIPADTPSGSLVTYSVWKVETRARLSPEEKAKRDAAKAAKVAAKAAKIVGSSTYGKSEDAPKF